MRRYKTTVAEAIQLVTTQPVTRLLSINHHTLAKPRVMGPEDIVELLGGASCVTESDGQPWPSSENVRVEPLE